MQITAVEHAGLQLRIVPPPPDLAPYISLYYRTDVAPGLIVEDLVPPEAANLRAGHSPVYEAAIDGGPLRPVPAMVLAGPTSRAARLRIGQGQFWGVGLHPLGFAKFVEAPASDFADRYEDIAESPVAAPIRPLLAGLLADTPPMAEGVERMTATFRSLLDRPVPQAEAILAAHAAQVSDLSRSVASLAREMRVSTRTLERFCSRNFGFPPQLLLRRQRFLRSLASFMTDPTMRWIHTLDAHYHDQAHFVRDFRRFMGMRPGDYAARTHPITGLAVRARQAARRAAMQGLHAPSPLPGRALAAAD